ncbi:MAG: NUDIX hydrolase [Anaerolineaceae bacterium]|nr:NUDIX hydrolase [Anaerolineaceae bacterium]
MKHSIISRKNIFNCHTFNIQELFVSLPDGRTRNYDLVDHRNSVTIIPIDKNGKIWFVEQFRMGSESSLIELPAGVIEENEKPLACATREIREEIGMSAGKMVYIGSVFLAPGYSNELNYIFLAKDLNPDPLQQDDDEFLSTKIFSREDLSELIHAGNLQDSKSLAALYLYERKFL